MQADGNEAALDTAWIRGTFGYFGLSPRRLELLHGATGSATRRAALLDRCYHIGNTLPEPAPHAAGQTAP